MCCKTRVTIRHLNEIYNPTSTANIPSDHIAFVPKLRTAHVHNHWNVRLVAVAILGLCFDHVDRTFEFDKMKIQTYYLTDSGQKVLPDVAKIQTSYRHGR